MTPARWLVDKSALWRVDRDEVGDRIGPLIRSGVAGLSILTALEFGYSARSTADYEVMRRRVLDRMIAVELPYRAERRAREVQAILIERGQHRAISIPDLLIAATAEAEGLTVLHYDADFEMIADVTGQPVEWVVPRGSI